MRSLQVIASLLAIPVIACSDTLGPSGDPIALSHDISVDQLGQALDTAPGRVEIRLERGTLVAREVEIKTADEMSDEESVRGAVTAVSASDASGTLTFDIGGLEITFASSARFRDGDGDLTITEFAASIQAALDGGFQPSVRAKRPAPAEPQAPDVATFEATDLRIQDGLESPKLELNVDADNYEANGAPPPEAWLRVLGLAIEIRSSTEIKADDDRNDEAEVRGIVASVDVDGRSVTLESGTVILVPEQGAFEDEGEGDDDEHLVSLAAVAQALADGLTVKAEAEGAVQSTDPLTIAAREVEFEIAGQGGEDDDEDDDGQGQNGVIEFERQVQSADVAAGTFVLTNGTVVQLTDSTVIEIEGDLMTLQAVADALATGAIVRAEGRATVESSGPPATLLALKVKWEVDD
ncbi:MAG: DUF5666 domain-containing protein [Gemmatimonadota bacterium]|nr:DUF5666 domain-containing protein [Gemmatimonadota bacterium]